MNQAFLGKGGLLLVGALFFVLWYAAPVAVFASQTNGTIDTTYKYVWGSRIGWVSLGTTNGNVHVTDATLTGYAWSEKYGWINLAPTTSGVKNDGAGNLSGYAWGENLGWIDFSGVKINTSGQFTGSATGTIVGSLNFDCANCRVITDWRPASARTASGGGGGGSGAGGGGELPFSLLQPPQAPPGGFKILINDGSGYTSSSLTLLTFNARSDAATMIVARAPDFIGAIREPYVVTKQWNLCASPATCSFGEYAVYAKFYTVRDRPSEIVSSSAIYIPYVALSPQLPQGTGGTSTVHTPPPSALSFWDQVKDFFFSLLPNFLKPTPAPHEPPQVAIMIPQEAPPVFQGKWDLMSGHAIGQFVFAPLPRDISLLAQKFPSLGRLFTEAGVARESDVSKLRSVTLSVPTLSEALGFATTTIGGEKKLANLPAIPLAALSARFKEKIPQEVVFARSIDEKIDLAVRIKVNESGAIEQSLSAVAGEPVRLMVRPERPAKEVKGYVVFTKRHAAPRGSASPLSRAWDFLGALLPAFSPREPERSFTDRFHVPAGAELASISRTDYESLAQNNAAPDTGQRLMLMEFDYADKTGEGIYTADIQIPRVDGDFDIVTRIRYKDPSLEPHEIHLVNVVDPEGYVYESAGEREIRIPGAVVTLYVLDAATKQYGKWPAENYNQENPQVTDVRGTYAFLVPEGYYYLRAEAPGYISYEGKPFEVKKGDNGIHVNIVLRSNGWWLSLFDWKTGLLALVAILLVYNFYRDRRREWRQKA